MKILASLLAIPLVGCSFMPHLVSGIPGSGKAKSENRTLGRFTAIQHNGLGDVDVQVGPANKLTITADDNLISKITTKIENGKLVIGTSTNIQPKTKIRLTLSVPALDRVELNGVGGIRVRNLHGRNFDVKLNGVGDLSAEGAVSELAAELNGVGDLYLRNLTARDASVKANGTGDADVYATNRLNVELNGVGDVTYRGKPERLNIDRKGVGSVRQR